ncbi:hypothetical protein KGF54_003893 [Candida jiufengensis]|uniref:uncharacterized protein n=1 Tax=Candida jiufengensis TaxID=497108 RepID=UPI0022256953|nr:uncharacterized protein KGF54_003893 [Candida jiufengensis]KAI5950819.1 hypothetical protein KGF54_003893 [Candida jiufengensis]
MVEEIYASSSDENENRISVRIEDGQFIKSSYKIDKNTRLRKMIRVFCDRHNQDINTLKFFFNNQMLNATDTPASLEMTNGDMIIVKNFEHSG